MKVDFCGNNIIKVDGVTYVPQKEANIKASCACENNYFYTINGGIKKACGSCGKEFPIEPLKEEKREPREFWLSNYKNSYYLGDWSIHSGPSSCKTSGEEIHVREVFQDEISITKEQLEAAWNKAGFYDSTKEDSMFHNLVDALGFKQEK